MSYVKGDWVCVTNLKNPGVWYIALVKEVAGNYVAVEGQNNRYHADTGLEARRGRAHHRIDLATQEQISAWIQRREVSRLQSEIDNITRAWRAVRPDGDPVERLRKVLALVRSLNETIA
jgi:hypothetical protein